jgi:hypothetical protein
VFASWVKMIPPELLGVRVPMVDGRGLEGYEDAARYSAHV